MKPLLLLIFFLLLLFEAQAKTSKLKTRQTSIIHVIGFDIEAKCENGKMVSSCILKTKAEMTGTPIIQLQKKEGSAILEMPCVISEDPLQCNCNPKSLEKNVEYELTGIKGMTTVFNIENQFCVLDKEYQLQANQLTPQEVVYQYESIKNSFEISFKNDIIHHKIPVKAQFNGKTIDITKLCQGFLPRKTQLVCTPNKKTLPEGNYTISIEHTCLADKEKILDVNVIDKSILENHSVSLLFSPLMVMLVILAIIM